MLSLGGKRLTPKVLDHNLYNDLGMLPLLWCFFAHLLILEYPDHHQTLISSSLYYPGPLHKLSSQSVHYFLSNVVHRQTNRQTNQCYQKHNLLCQGGNEAPCVNSCLLIIEQSVPCSYVLRISNENENFPRDQVLYMSHTPHLLRY